MVARGPGACPSADKSSGRGPQDTSSAQQDEVDCGKAGASRRRAESPGPLRQQDSDCMVGGCASRTAQTKSVDAPAGQQLRERGRDGSKEGRQRNATGRKTPRERKKGRAETVGERFPPVFIKCQTFLKQDLWLIFYFEIILGNCPKVDTANLRHMTALDDILLLIYHDKLRVPEN